MAPHAEPSPPPSPTMEHTKSPPASHSLFLSHISSVPILADSQSLLQSYSPRMLTSAFNKASDLTQTYVPPSVLSRADKLGDAVLTQLECTFPAVKTPTEGMTARPKAMYEKVVTRPITFVQTAADTYATAGKEHIDVVKHNIYGIYKTYAEPVIGEYTNEYVRKVNDRLEEAMETKMPKSYSEAVVETTNGETTNGEGTSSDGGTGDGIELYRSAKLARSAVERGRVRFLVPLKSMAGKTMDDVREGGAGIKAEIKGSPAKVRDGAVYMWKVMDEEVEREKSEQGGVGVKGVVKVSYRVGERCAGEIMGVGLVVAAKGIGAVWGIWEAGRDKVKTT